MEETSMNFKSIIQRDYLDNIKSHIASTGYSLRKLLRIISYDSLTGRFRFDAIITVSDNSGKQHRLRVGCEIEVNHKPKPDANSFRNFRITGIEIDRNQKPRNPQTKLTNSLVPLIQPQDLDRHAEDILKHIYPEALKNPTRVNTKLFAKRLGLRIEERHLSPNNSMFGQIIFHDTVIEFYDKKLHRFSCHEVPGGTILTDPQAAFMRNLGCRNNTIIHECVHWMKHSKHIALRREYNINSNRFTCRVNETVRETVRDNERKPGDNDRIEWQANALAPRILMPIKTFKQKADELIAKYKSKHKEPKPKDMLESVITKLHKFFGVSKQAARIRMIDTGYTEAADTLGYTVSEPSETSDHTDRCQTVNTNTPTHIIPATDGIHEYKTNPKFRQVINTGNFMFINGHYCINAPKYITRNSHGILTMTGYALDHTEECCLSFERITADNPHYGAEHYTKTVLYQCITTKHQTKHIYKQTIRDKKVEALSAEAREVIGDIKEASNIATTLPTTFGNAVITVMKWRGMTIENLCELSMLEDKTIQRMRGNNGKRESNIKKVVALCIGLRLPSCLSLPLIERAGLHLLAIESESVYLHMLMVHYSCSIHECNDFIASLGYTPLVKLK